jgi:hypothetical protein
VTTVLSIPVYLTLDAFSNASGLHPEMVTRLVDLGLLDAMVDARGALRFVPSQLGRAARIQRLREGLSVNYAAMGLVMDLLERIDTLEAALRRQPQPAARTLRGRNRPWTRTG